MSNDTSSIEKKTFIAHKSLWEDINNGWVWISTDDSSAEEAFSGKRRIICIKSNQSKVHCEVLFADKQYLEKWPEINSKSGRDAISDQIFLNAWYQQVLKISIKNNANPQLTIKITKCPFKQVWWQLMACLEHPQTIVFISTLLGMISVGLGIISLGFGISSFMTDRMIIFNLKTFIIGCIFFIGLFPIGYCIYRFYKRATYANKSR